MGDEAKGGGAKSTASREEKTASTDVKSEEKGSDAEDGEGKRAERRDGYYW